MSYWLDDAGVPTVLDDGDAPGQGWTSIPDTYEDWYNANADFLLAIGAISVPLPHLVPPSAS